MQPLSSTWGPLLGYHHRPNHKPTALHPGRVAWKISKAEMSFGYVTLFD